MRQAHTLERTEDGLRLRVVLWLPVKDSLRHTMARPNKPNVTIVPWATEAETAALRRGEVYEQVIEVPIPTSGTADQRLDAVKAAIEAEYRAAAGEIAGRRPHPFYGYVFDGTAWLPI